MNEKAASNIHWSFWVIGAVALIWNVLGSVNFIAQMNPDVVASMPETHRAIIETRPAWATAGFGVGVIIGAFGCLLLLLRKSAAFYFLVAALLGVVVTAIHTIDVANSVIKFSSTEVIVMIVMPVVVAAILVWYEKLAENKGWVD